MPSPETAQPRLRPLLRRARDIARWLAPVRYAGGESHFVRDYRRLVTRLLARHPLDEAMSLAVGGDYERIGAVECALLRHAGLRDGMALVDFGCGSGRLAWALGEQRVPIDYCGIDIDQRLLDYARTRSPSHFRFVLNQALRLPAADAAADMVCAFSVFTHLRHAETYLYLEDIHRVLRPGGILVFSFLEFAQPRHWQVFADTAAAERGRGAPHLNQFIERNAIDLWAEKLGFERPAYVDADAAPWGAPGPLGQSAAILRRR
jgi:ubiquinone/menaquinone biosynthesis C-methylase UbiE